MSDRSTVVISFLCAWSLAAAADDGNIRPSSLRHAASLPRRLGNRDGRRTDHVRNSNARYDNPAFFPTEVGAFSDRTRWMTLDRSPSLPPSLRSFDIWNRSSFPRILLAALSLFRSLFISDFLPVTSGASASGVGHNRKPNRWRMGDGERGTDLDSDILHGVYRVTVVVGDLGWGGFDLGSSPCCSFL